jgi:predicted PurR-regulated permease PerM
VPADPKPVPLEKKPDEPIFINPQTPPVISASLRSQTDAYQIAAWVITGLALLLVLRLRLLSALLAGLLVFELILFMVPVLRIGRLSRTRAKFLAVSLLAVIIVLLLALLIWSFMHFLYSESNSISALLGKMAEIIDGLRFKLPSFLAGFLPEGPDDFQAGAVHWLRSHAREVHTAGKGLGVGLAHILVGMVIGAIISLTKVSEQPPRPLVAALGDRVSRFRQAFHAVVFAQVRISTLNALLTWLYLEAFLPLLGIRLPFTMTIVALTFFLCLLPVIGNVCSNAVIVVVSLSVSMVAAVSSLIFLVVIHKLEYFLNAHFVGSRTQTQTWELLAAMLVMEAAFGIPGLIAAPIYYAYLKNELTDCGLV